MSNLKYIRAQATARRLIRENGVKFLMSRVVEGTPDPVAGTVGQPTTETQEVYAVVLPPSSSRDEYLDQFKGEGGILDLSRIKSVIISTEGLKWRPEELDRFHYRGEEWLFCKSQGLDPDGVTDILFKGYIRRV